MERFMSMMYVHMCLYLRTEMNVYMYCINDKYTGAVYTTETKTQEWNVDKYRLHQQIQYNMCPMQSWLWRKDHVA